MKNKLSLNIGYQQRVSGGDYFEFRKYDSVDLLLATETKENLNNLAINNERVFQKRFGFYASEGIRKQFVEMISEIDLSDHEIKWLKRAGFLSIKQHKIDVDSWSFVMTISCFAIAVFSVNSLIFLVHAIFFSRELIGNYICLFGFCLLFAYIAYCTFNYIVVPGSILKRFWNKKNSREAGSICV